MKRILIVTQYFYPENFRINELAVELVNKGYQVDALVGIPNYPEGTYTKDYGLFKKRKEIYHGVKIYRCFQFPRGKKASNLRLSLNYLSYMFSASAWIIFKFAFKSKYDTVIAYEPSPITIVIPAIILGKIRRTPVLSWIQDIWPDSIVHKATASQKKMLFPVLSAITEYVYRNSNKILISSKGMAELICRNRDYSRKIEYVPNWCDDFHSSNCNLSEKFPKGFNIMMAGNLGEGVGPDYIISLSEELADIKEINIILVGSGSRVDFLRKEKEKRHLENLYLTGKFQYNEMGNVYANADALLLSLKAIPEKHLDVTVPSRLQAYMSAGKPIFAMIGSGAGNIIKESDCGFIVPPGEHKALAELIRNKYQDHELLKTKGENGREAYEKEFTLQSGVNHFEELIGYYN